MNKVNKISKLLRKKTNSHFKISLTMFIISLILLSTSLVFLINQYNQLERDFIKNNNTHVIEITSLSISDKETSYLKFSDMDLIKKNLTGFIEREDYKIFKESMVNFGVSDKKGISYFISGIDDEAFLLFGIDNDKKGVGYSRSYDEEEKVLDIPKIEISTEGFTGDGHKEYPLEIKRINGDTSPLELYEFDTEKMYVNMDTFREIIKIMYDLDWNDFVSEYDSTNKFGIQGIYKIYVYVNDLNNVDSIAEIINDLGFNTNYTFKSFENFSNSISNTVLIASILICIILLITSINIILSFNSYYKMQRKDIGILKQFGYSQNVIYKIYSRTLNLTFLIIMTVIIIYTIFIGMFFIKYNYLKSIMFIFCFMVFILYIICFIIRFLLKKYCKENIISLLKKSKEFE